MKDYDTVIVAFPNWWTTMPMAVFTFLESYDFAGKTVCPLITHGGSGFSNFHIIIFGKVNFALLNFLLMHCFLLTAAY